MSNSLYERLGGAKGIADLVDDIVEAISSERAAAGRSSTAAAACPIPIAA